jgi:carboxymethylenebutenolidase
VGGAAVRGFYETYFLTGHPPDTQAVPIARTVGADRIVDEMAFSFTHTIEMPWILPGVPPTGKHVEVAVVAVVEFQNGKVSGERIYWDQASVLAQVGLIDPGYLPITGSEACAKAVDPASGASNILIQRASVDAAKGTAAYPEIRAGREASLAERWTNTIKQS